MGALIAVVHKNRESAFTTAIEMLGMLSHRGSDSFGIASSREVVIKNALEELRRERIDSEILIGQGFAQLLQRDKTQPVQNNDSTLVFEGRLFPPPAKGEVDFAAGKSLHVKEEAVRFIRRFEGSYAFATAVGREVIVGRDAVGTCPLYFGENREVCALASERKALWKVGINETDSFPPGKLALVDKTGFHFRAAKVIAQPPVKRVSMQHAAQQLKEALVQSTKARVSDVEEVAVAFSGGVDSSVVASIARTCNVDAHLIHVTLRETDETDFANRAAEAVGLPLHVAKYTLRDVEAILPTVLWLIEEPNPVNVSIATPVFWVAEQAAKLGLSVLLAGQGGDELFGGYKRYLEDYEEYGLAGLQTRLYKDVMSSHVMNFQRDNKVCAFHKLELRMPFADWGVIKLALSLPARLKIASPRDELRKRVLRQAAKNLAIPEFISEKPKNAIQYTTGVNQAIKRLAKKEGLTVREYLEEVFRKTCLELNENG
jgi:asparagine synthase (glutamine-hydrolysing)